MNNTTTPVKEELASLLEHLPNDATIEDVQYHLYTIDKVRKGLESIERDGGLTHEDVEQKLSRWLVN